MYRDIYEHINNQNPATYQIKVKGRLNNALCVLFSDATITIETADTQHPITMITVDVQNQKHLWELLSHLHDHNYPMIALSCVTVHSETTPAKF